MADKRFLVNIDLDQNQLKNITLHPLASVPVATGVDGQIYYNTGDQLTYQYKAGATNAWEVIGGSGTTNLGTGTQTSTSWEITSSSGSSVTLLEATVSNAGLLSAGDWSYIQGLPTLISNYVRWDDSNLLTGGPGASQAGWFLNGNVASWASASQTQAVSQQSIKDYVLAQVAGGVNYQGGYNADTDTPAIEASPGVVGVLKGWMYTVTISTGATFYGTTLEVGDVLIAEVDTPTTGADWTIVQKNETGVVTNTTGGTLDNIAVFGASGQIIKDGGATIASLQSPDATETVAGLVEEATQAEVNAGTAAGSQARLFVNPAKLRSTLGITADLITTLKYEQTIGDGALTTIPVTHSIGRQRVITSVTTTASPFDEVECRVEYTSATVTTFFFNTAPALNEYTVVIIG